MKSKRNLLLGIIALLLVGIATLLALIFLGTVKNYKLPDDASYYVNGTEYSMPKGTIAEYDVKNNTVIVKLKEEDVELDVMSLPIYYNNSETVLLTNNITYVDPTSNTFTYYMCTPFTEVQYREDILRAVFSNGKKNVEVYRGFLFDNKNTYVFLEEMYVSYNGTTVKCGPLSYAIVDNKNWIQLFNSTTNEYVYERLTIDKVEAKSVETLYSIYLNSDIGIVSNKEFIIIASNELKENLFEAFK